MAANFWTSTHCKLLIPKERLLETHAKDREKGFTFEQIQQVKVHLVQYLADVAQSTVTFVRQRVVATASVYFRRFYIRNNFCDYDPRIVAPTCLYLACKVEESQMQAKLLFHYFKKVNSQKYQFMPVVEMKHLLDFELLLLEALDYDLVVFDPYNLLIKYLADAQATAFTERAWALLNDSYRSDLCLVHAPHMVALGVVVATCIIEQRDSRGWLEGLNTDLDQVYDIVMELFNVYEKHREPIAGALCQRYLEVLR